MMFRDMRIGQCFSGASAAWVKINDTQGIVIGGAIIPMGTIRDIEDNPYSSWVIDGNVHYYALQELITSILDYRQIEKITLGGIEWVRGEFDHDLVYPAGREMDSLTDVEISNVIDSIRETCFV